LRYPTLFRTWKHAGYPTYNCTILEAARATSASPYFFKGIKLGGPIQLQYIDGGLRCNNPIKYILEEAKTLFGLNRPLSCIISLGNGTGTLIGLEQPDAFQKLIPMNVISTLRNIAADCEMISEEVATDLSQSTRPPLYVRLNVNYSLNFSFAEWEKMPEVQARAHGYLQTFDVSKRIDMLVKALNGTGRSQYYW